MRNTQRNLFDQLKTPSAKREQKRRLVHGGEKSAGKRKSKRPLSTKQWIHLVLKADKAKRKLSMLAARNAQWIDRLLREKAKKFGIEIRDLVNMGNHLHIEIRILNRDAFQNFLRSVTNLIARHVTGARKGHPFGKFWSGLALTRVITSFLELTQLDQYFMANRIQLCNGYEARERYLDCVNERIQRLRRGSTP